VISRILAVIGALGMVFGAYVYRYGMPGGGGDGGGGRNGGDATAALVCAAELGDQVCDAAGADVTIEPVMTTAKRLIASSSGDVRTTWVVPSPWPEMVDEARARASKPALFEKGPERLATTPLVVVARKGQLPAECPRPVTWRCLGDAGQSPTYRVAGEPTTSSYGLFARAAALGGFFGNLDYATNDLDEQPDARTWLENLNRNLAASAGFGARSLESFVSQRGTASVFLTTTAAARDLRNAPDFEVATPTAPVLVGAVYARPAGTDGKVPGALRPALDAVGWEPVTGRGGSAGLPSPGVLLALSEVGG
jgi:hypothetical protein